MMLAVPDHSRSAGGEIVRRRLGPIRLRLLVEPPETAAASAARASPGATAAPSPGATARSAASASPSSASPAADAAPGSSSARSAAGAAPAAACRECGGSREGQAEDENAAGQRRDQPLGRRSR